MPRRRLRAPRAAAGFGLNTGRQAHEQDFLDERCGMATAAAVVELRG